MVNRPMCDLRYGEVAYLGVHQQHGRRDLRELGRGIEAAPARHGPGARVTSIIGGIQMWWMTRRAPVYYVCGG